MTNNDIPVLTTKMLCIDAAELRAEFAADPNPGDKIRRRALQERLVQVQAELDRRSYAENWAKPQMSSRGL
jgi:hypothetical protein